MGLIRQYLYPQDIEDIFFGPRLLIRYTPKSDGDTLIQVPPSSKFRVPSSEFQVPPSSAKFRLFQVPKFPVYYYYIGFYSILLNFYWVLQNTFFITVLCWESHEIEMVLCLIATFRRCYLKFYSPVQSWVVTVNDLLLEYGLPSAYELFVNPPSKWR